MVFPILTKHSYIIGLNAYVSGLVCFYFHNYLKQNLFLNLICEATSLVKAFKGELIQHTKIFSTEIQQFEYGQQFCIFKYSFF